MTDITYVSLFSGIEAFSVAASRIEGVRWHPVFFSEIEPFPCAVLAHHFPNVPNLGDICKIRVDRDKGNISNGTATIPLPRTGIDILAGGSPCQDVSVAGKRAGMSEGSGTRSSLAFEYARMVEELRPRVVVWENVPGVLSSNGGRDFLAFQRSLVERGYSLAYRVLDAQYARVDGYPLAVPQRRRRVWIVGCLGADESVPAQILFERPGLLGDIPPRRTQGQGSASPPGYRVAEHDRVVGCAGGSGSDVSEVLTARGFKGIGARNGQISGPFVALAESASFDGNDVSATLHKPNGSPGFSDQEIFAQQGAYLARVLDMTYADEALREVDGGAAPTLQSRMGTGGNQVPLVCTEPSVCKTLSAEGFDGMPDIQKGNGMPVVAVRTAQTGAGGSGVANECAYTLDQVKGQAVAIGFKAVQSANGGLGDEREVAPTLSSQPSALEPTVAVAFDANLSYNPVYDDAAADTLEVSHRVGVATMLKVRCGKDTYIKPDGSVGTAGKGPLASEESAFTLSATQDQTLILNHIVRRLTPTECERLQGFPDGWTRIPYRGNPADQCPDSPRYKALGNSWATNCAEWVLRRIVAAMVLGLVDGRDG